jgi:hypothetical protein
MPAAARARSAALGLVLLLVGAAGVLPACHQGGSEKAFCAKVRAVPEFASVFGTFDPADPAAAKAAFDGAVQSLRTLEDASPASIRHDVAKIADVADSLAAALADVDDPATAADRLSGMKTDLEAVAPASARVTAYAKDHCGVDLGPPPPATAPTTAAGAPSTTGG